MKLWVVFLWEPHETPCYHQYFVDQQNATNYFDDLFDSSHYRNKYWEIEEIETKD